MTYAHSGQFCGTGRAFTADIYNYQFVVEACIFVGELVKVRCDCGVRLGDAQAAKHGGCVAVTNSGTRRADAPPAPPSRFTWLWRVVTRVPPPALQGLDRKSTR